MILRPEKNGHLKLLPRGERVSKKDGQEFLPIWQSFAKKGKSHRSLKEISLLTFAQENYPHLLLTNIITLP